MATYKKLINNKPKEITISELTRNIVVAADSWNEAKLLIFLVTQKHGFKISTEWLMQQLVLKRSKLSETKNKLVAKNLIAESAKEIEILYDEIQKMIAKKFTNREINDIEKFTNREQKIHESRTNNSRTVNKKFTNREFETPKTAEAVSVEDTDIDTNIDIDIDCYIDNSDSIKVNFSSEEKGINIDNKSSGGNVTKTEIFNFPVEGLIFIKVTSKQLTTMNGFLSRETKNKTRLQPVSETELNLINDDDVENLYFQLKNNNIFISIEDIKFMFALVAKNYGFSGEELRKKVRDIFNLYIEHGGNTKNYILINILKSNLFDFVCLNQPQPIKKGRRTADEFK